MATPPDPARWDRFNRLVDSVGAIFAIVAIAAVASPVSQLTLSPVYGSIPSSINHQYALPITFSFGIILHRFLEKSRTQRVSIRSALPLISIAASYLSHVALFFSAQLGFVGGPALAGFISCHTIIIAAAYALAQALQILGDEQVAFFKSFVPRASTAIVTFILLERYFSLLIPLVVSGSHWINPADLQLVVASGFAALDGPAPGVVVGTWLLVAFSYLANPRGTGLYASSNLDSLIEPYGWSVLNRTWSTTGYVSVLENHADQYRMLRCDHSLLGGEWLINDDRRQEGWTTNEPIYSVFSMLEAVRLLDTGVNVPDDRARALVIGLGIGTAPKSLIQHGIDTTIIELDPAVYDFATQYFGLPTNHTIILEDAVAWTHQQAARDTFDVPRYNYIIHDVFTGGAEPLPLFTTTFLKDLRSLLTDDGVAAINYAGDLDSPLTRQILNTIDKTFDRQCQMYSDEAAKADGSIEKFNNFIVFCRNSPGEIKFRAPTTQDYLGSLNKRSYLHPKPEQQVQLPARDTAEADDVLDVSDMRSWRSAQEESAIKHWHIMRTMIPARIWELY